MPDDRRRYDYSHKGLWVPSEVQAKTKVPFGFCVTESPNQVEQRDAAKRDA